MEEALLADVTGETYRLVAEKMQQLEQELLHREQERQGFEDERSLKQAVELCHAGHRVYMPSKASLLYVNHLGEVLTEKAWKAMYSNIFFYTYIDDNDKTRRCVYDSDTYRTLSDARLYSEQTDGLRKPLLYRDYYRPKGYYNPEKGCFNAARPFKTWARDHGRDVEYIFEFLRHISGICYPHLLQWLRTKMLYPTRKTGIIPCFTGEQGTGKSTFVSLICAGMFEEENIAISSKIDLGARFNADIADKLVIGIEEKLAEDPKNATNLIKDAVTNTMVRKEHKGIDPTFQESYQEFVMTTNDLVAFKFEDTGRQRRFMVMDVDNNFTREHSELADEVFTKLYGIDKFKERVGVSFKDDKEAIEQFKWELLHEKDCKDISLHNFPQTEAYQRCITLPRTNIGVDIEALMQGLAPFIKASLKARHIVTELVYAQKRELHTVLLSDVIQCGEDALVYWGKKLSCARVGINRILIFRDEAGTPLPHAIVEKTVLGMRRWLDENFKLKILSDAAPPGLGWQGQRGPAYRSPTFWFAFSDDPLDVIQAKKDAFIEKSMREHRKPGELPEPHYADKPSDELPEPHYADEKTAPSETIEENIPDWVAIESILEKRRPEFLGHFTSQLVSKSVHRTKIVNVTPMLGEWETVNEMINPKGRRVKDDQPDGTRANVGRRNTFLLECDDMPLREQLPIFNQLHEDGVVWRIVYSGSKSYHGLVTIMDEPDDNEQYKFAAGLLIKTMSEQYHCNFDIANTDPLRLTRTPMSMRRETGKIQELIGNWIAMNPFDFQWRKEYGNWVDRPLILGELKGCKLIPTKQIYKDACQAICDGTFFIDPAWNGKRNTVFWAAYRLVRSMGFTHAEVWKEINSQLKDYYKKQEIWYWKSRANCALIKRIDEDIDGGNK